MTSNSMKDQQSRAVLFHCSIRHTEQAGCNTHTHTRHLIHHHHLYTPYRHSESKHSSSPSLMFTDQKSMFKWCLRVCVRVCQWTLQECCTCSHAAPSTSVVVWFTNKSINQFISVQKHSHTLNWLKWAFMVQFWNLCSTSACTQHLFCPQPGCLTWSRHPPPTHTQPQNSLDGLYVPLGLMIPHEEQEHVAGQRDAWNTRRSPLTPSGNSRTVRRTDRRMDFNT